MAGHRFTGEPNATALAMNASGLSVDFTVAEVEAWATAQGENINNAIAAWRWLRSERDRAAGFTKAQLRDGS